MNNVPEFVDTYSDDTIFVMQAREALLTHPLIKAYDSLTDASVCRLFLYTAIGSIEAFVNDLIERTQDELLKGYLNRRNQNKEQMDALDGFLRSRGLIPNENALKDFLIMRLLRNEITHSSRKEERRAQIKAAGFPEDTRQLTAEHLARFQSAYQHILLALGICLGAERTDQDPVHPVKFEQQACPAPSGVISFDIFRRLPWRYLERGAGELYRTIERAISERVFDWTNGQGVEELESRMQLEIMEQFYLGAFKAGMAGCEQFKERVDVARDALRFWDCYLGFQQAQLPGDVAAIRKAVVTIAELSKRGRQFPPMNMSELSYQQWRVIAEHLPSVSGTSKEELAMALLWGSNAYRIIPNITGVWLFTSLCPCIDSANAGSYVKAAHQSLDLFDLRWQWYALVERGGVPEGDKLIGYRNILGAIESAISPP